MHIITVNIRDVMLESGNNTWEKFVNHCFKRGLIDINYDKGEIQLQVSEVHYVSEVDYDGSTRIRIFNRMCRDFERTLTIRGIKVFNDGEQWEIRNYPFKAATKKFNLVKDKSNETDNYIFEKSEVDKNLRYYPYLVEKAIEKVSNLYGITLYVKGPTIAYVAVEEACKKTNCKLKPMFYDHDDERWLNESILSYKGI